MYRARPVDTFYLVSGLFGSNAEATLFSGWTSILVCYATTSSSKIGQSPRTCAWLVIFTVCFDAEHVQRVPLWVRSRDSTWGRLKEDHVAEQFTEQVLTSPLSRQLMSGTTAVHVLLVCVGQLLCAEPPLACPTQVNCFVETFMVDSGVPQVEVERTMKLLESSNFKGCPRPPPVEPSHDEPMDQVETVMDGSLSLTDFDVPSETKKENLHTLYSTVRSGILGVDPKSVRNEMRLKLEAGYYLSETGRKGTLILHKLGACFAIPGLDYMKFSYIGPALPPRSQYHQICKLCARSEKLGDSMGDSSDTQTSSSSEES